VEKDVFFREVQRFGQWWLWLAGTAAVAAGLIGYTAAVVETLRRGAAEPGTAAGMMIGGIAVALACAAVAAMFFARLIVEVREDGLYVRFFPLHLSFKRIPLERAVRVGAVRYRPILQYGGWGIRWTWRGKAYNVSGSRGVRIDFENGKHLLIGSQRPQELAAAIARIAPESATVETSRGA